jgi:hypothetical protein
MTRSTGRLCRGAAALALLLASAGLGAPAGASPPLGRYLGVATASGARVTFLVPGQFAVEEIVDAGGPLAQSRLDPATGDGFASLPYPGGSAVAYQGLLNVATGLSSPFAYPFYVSAAQPGQPAQELTDPSGTYGLKATAGPGRTTATARLRPGAPHTFVSGTEAASSVTGDADTVVATASSLAEGVMLGDGILSVGTVLSSAVTTVSASHDPVTRTDLTVSALQVGGRRIAVGPAGFELLGTPVPLQSPDVQKVIDDTLRPAGLQMHFIAAQPVTGGAQSAAIEINSRQGAPNMPASTMTLRLGGAVAAVTRGEAPLPLPEANVGVGPAAGTPAAGSPPVEGPQGSGAPGAPATAIPSFAEVPSPSGSAQVGATARPAYGADSGTGFSDGTPAAASGSSNPVGAAPSGGESLVAQPVLRPRDVASVRVLYAVAAAFGLAALASAAVWSVRGGIPAWARP